MPNHTLRFLFVSGSGSAVQSQKRVTGTMQRRSVRLTMAFHVHTAEVSRAIGSHMPLNVALAVLPTLPRPLLAPLVANAIERLDAIDGDADLEPEVTEQDDEPEMDDHCGGNVEDEGESAEVEDAGGCGSYGIDQSTGPLPVHTH
jgi:hypothetical protein